MNKNRVVQEAEQFKLVLVGESGVGKSCLMQRFIKDEWHPQHKSTLGAEFGAKILILHNYANSRVKLVLWDTAGQEKYRSIVRNFYRNSSAVLLVFDLTKFDLMLNRKHTFDQLRQWLKDSRENSPKHTEVVLIGTHLDQENQRAVTFQEMEEWAQSEAIESVFEVSSFTGANIDNTFEMIACRLLQKRTSVKEEAEHVRENPGALSSLLRNSVPGAQVQESKCCNR